MASLGDMLIRVGLDTTEFSSGISEVGNKLDSLSKQADTAASGWSAFGSAAMSAGAVLSASVTAPLVALASASLNSAANLETTRTALTNMLGSATEANTLIQQMQDFAAKTPFQFDQLASAVQLLTAYGFKASELLPIMQIVGDTAAGVGAGAEGVERIVRALGQMQGKGTVAAQEMQQLAELGIPSWQILADAIGTDVPNAMKLVEKKAIEAKDAIPALLAGMNEKFHGMMEEQSKTLSGKWSTFKDNLNLALIEIGNALAPIAKSLIDFLTDVANNVKSAAEWFGKLPEPVKEFTVGAAALLAAVGPLLLALGGLASSISAIATAWPLLTAAFGAVGAAVFSPVGLAVAGVTAALVALGVWIYDNWDGIKNRISTAWDGLKELWEYVWNSVKAAVIGVWDSIKSAVDDILQPIRDALGPLWDDLSEAWSAVWEGIKSAVETVWDNIKSTAETVWNGIKSFFSSIWDGIKSTAENIWKSIANYIDAFIEAAKKISGVSKILGLENETAGAKSFAQEMDKAKKAVDDNAGAAKAAESPIKNLSEAKANLAKAAENVADKKKKAKKETDEYKKAVQNLIKDMHESKIKFDDLAIATEVARQRKAALKEEIKETLSAFVALLLRMEEGKSVYVDRTQQVNDMEAAFDQAQKTMDLMGVTLTGVDNIAKAALPTLTTNIKEMYTALETTRKEIENKKDIYGTLGLPSPEEVAAKKQKIIEAYHAILNDPNASPKMIKEAHKAMIDQLDEIEKKYEKFRTFGDNVKDLFKGVSRTISDTLFDLNSNESFASRLEKGLERVKDAFITKTLDPVKKAFENFVENTLNKLVMPALNNISGSLGNIFGGGGGGSTPSVPGAPGGGGGGGGSGAGGALGSLGGIWTGLIAGGLSILGSVIGASMMSGDLGKIEENTRKTQIGINEGQGVIYILWLLDDHGWRLTDLLVKVKDEKLGKIEGQFDTLLNEHTEKIRNYCADIKNNTADIATNLKQPAQITINIDGNVVGNQQFIDDLTEAIGKKLKLAGAA